MQRWLRIKRHLLQLATADPAITVHLDSKRIVKVIYVPDKLLNLVVA